MKTQWVELSFAMTHESADLLADYLSDLGSEGVEIEDPNDLKDILRENPYEIDEKLRKTLENKEVRVRAYFALADKGRFPADLKKQDTVMVLKSKNHHLIDLKELELMIRDRIVTWRANSDLGAGYLGWRRIDEEDWSENWKRYYQTQHVTRRIVINPSWIDYEAKQGEIVISLDPGSAFGTGQHESTILCIKSLEERVYPGCRVLDLGTGSGILALVSAKLGAGSVEAIDIDERVTQIARENFQINNTAVWAHTGSLSDAGAPPYDIIVANIVADVIISLIDEIPSFLSQNGRFIASGIIHDQLERVKKAARNAKLECIEVHEQSDWCALVMRQHPEGR